MSEMGRCRDCRWWIVLDEEPDWGQCVSPSQEGSLKDLVQVNDGSPLDTLYTRDGFGCVGFEAKG